ncbi:TetR/AcrR family transcriptional regulator [Mucilaginibacter sp. X5P1]|uniref:TetR/AcrR family transcriptional regulator n=1 Tax=Mucilaginibacter sp. X5P1 TaxID=2723088 RepID=UPI00160B1F5F|nr:TetR/AcrR family transcriptional regulator [Mucilaginibacter sp. X5P1]MBB6141847.1 TetR/AcrR family transcriptional repressor of nem operon [Mucilaginibacter sp. X5P1]
MPRVQLFDKEKVLKNAMEVFWKKGFNGTSTRDLEKATGLGTSSIYNSFGDKESLFFETLQYYLEAEKFKVSQSIQGSTSALQALKALIECLLHKGGTAEIEVMGCFMVNSITELANHHPRLSQFAIDTRTGAITKLKELLQKAQQQGEIPKGNDSSQLAVYLHTVIMGLKVSGMLATDPKELQSVIDITIQNLTKL